MQQHALSTDLSTSKTGAEIGPLTTNVKQPSKHLTYALVRGTQKAMIDAAKLADQNDYPINRLLTIRTAAMRQCGGGGILRESDAAGCVIDILNRYARWCRVRGVPIVNIWVREFCHHNQEHLHIGYHMPKGYDDDFADQLALWLEEPRGNPDDNESTVAISEDGSWHVARCVKGGSSGHHIAAYLGKSEPNEYLTGWGKLRRNNLKHRRRCKGGYGPIEGTTKHHYRWGTSLAVGRTQRDRNGFYSN